MDQASFWAGVQADAPMEKTGGSFQDLPAGVWVLVETPPAETGGGSVPQVKIQEGTSKKTGESYSFKKFNTGLIVKGGDASVSAETYKDAYGPFMDAFVNPGEKEDQTKPISGRLTGILNAFFASGVAAEEKDPGARSAARWAVTVGALRKAAETYTGTLEQMGGDMGMYMAAVAAHALATQPRRLLIKTMQDKYTDGSGNSKTSIKVGSFEDATPANIEKRKVVVFSATTAF